MVASEDLANTNFDAAQHIRMVPALQAGNETGDEPTYTVEIADPTGHSVVEMTKTELIDQAVKSQGSWVFVDNRMVASEDLANTNFDAAQHIRMVPALQAGNDTGDEPTYTVEIADPTGHSVVEMTKNEIVEQAKQQSGSWVFVDSCMVATDALASTDLSTAQHIRMVPALLAGQ
jgi:C4-type Zn-finger protein